MRRTITLMSVLSLVVGASTARTPQASATHVLDSAAVAFGGGVSLDIDGDGVGEPSSDPDERCQYDDTTTGDSAELFGLVFNGTLTAGSDGLGDFAGALVVSGDILICADQELSQHLPGPIQWRWRVASWGVPFLAVHPGVSQDGPVCVTGEILDGFFDMTGATGTGVVHANWTVWRPTWAGLSTNCRGALTRFGSSANRVALKASVAWNPSLILFAHNSTSIGGSLHSRAPEPPANVDTLDMSQCTREVLIDPFFEVRSSELADPERSVCVLLLWPIRQSFRITLRQPD